MEPTLLRVDIPLSTLSNPGEWGDMATLYGLDSKTIGVAPGWVSEWLKRAWRIEMVPLEKNAASVSFVLPKSFQEFYAIFGRGVEVSVVGNACLLMPVKGA